MFEKEMNKNKNSLPKRSYAEVCRSKYNYDMNDTRDIETDRDPGLLVKLRDVAKQCKASYRAHFPDSHFSGLALEVRS